MHPKKVIKDIFDNRFLAKDWILKTFLSASCHQGKFALLKLAHKIIFLYT